MQEKLRRFSKLIIWVLVLHPFDYVFQEGFRHQVESYSLHLLFKYTGKV